MMPGLKRKARLLIDWNVQLLFGRDASELGQLGHPPSLADSGRPRGAPSAGNGHGRGRRRARRPAARIRRAIDRVHGRRTVPPHVEPEAR